MRLAIISDIHGNLEAFTEVLRDIDASGIDEIFCLGDNVGYGPDPEHVVGIMRERAIPCVMGNHELGIVDPLSLDWFNPVARRSLVLTGRLISAETLEYMRGLNTFMVKEGCLFVHGAPPASISTYLFELTHSQLFQLARTMQQDLCFVGHTHDLGYIRLDEEESSPMVLSEGIFPLAADCKYIVNVGSVGQPRDGDNRAKYVVWDTTAGTIEVKFVRYDIATTVEKILRLGLPSVNARRLW
ncbi:metallophosphoesterase family protein [Desulfoferrobacter suflitae]|uniref:metallophosphoesterase family protein n=1 Tax=Desulfoferrobacter suflitae TaxID=2865782 RepID=UPI002164CF92|nr:metallophosphoesterase family protein [Desulfoferrobacter suflitae]MCK8602090.1 metallophosphoesterase family protein [Desulfoferrobacter suflitae]